MSMPNATHSPSSTSSSPSTSFAMASSAGSSKKRSTSVHYDKSKGLWQPRKSSGSIPSGQMLDVGGFDVASGAAAKTRDPATSRIVRHLVVEAAVERPKVSEDVAAGIVIKMFLHLSVPPPDLPMPNAAALFPLLPARTADRTHLLSASIHPYPSSSGPREYAEAVTTLGLGGPRDWIKSRKALSSSVGSGLTSSVLSTTSSAFPPQASVEHPDAAIVERAKDVCLELRRGPSAPEEQDARGSASFVAVLEMSTDWTFQGPGWPFAAAMPTPPCLRNTLRLSLPHVNDLLPAQRGSDDHVISHTTYPRLRERRTPAATSRSTPSFLAHARPIIPRPSASPMPAELKNFKLSPSEEERALADESEPEVPINPALDSSDSSVDGEAESASKTIEGVFPSTDRLWIIFAPQRPPGKHASAPKGQARVTATVDGDQVSLEVQLSTCFRSIPFASPADPIELSFSTSFGSDDTGDDYLPLSMDWSFADPSPERKGIIGVSLPRVSLDPGSSPAGEKRPGLDSSPSKYSTASFASESDLLHTKAPFPAESPIKREEEGDASFESSFRSSAATSILATPSPGIAHIPAFDPTPSPSEVKLWLDLGRFVDSADPDSARLPAELRVDFVGRIVVPVEVDEEKTFRLPIFSFQTTDLSLFGASVVAGSISCPDPDVHGILPVPLPRDDQADRAEICLVGDRTFPGRRVVAQLKDVEPVLPPSLLSGGELDRLDLDTPSLDVLGPESRDAIASVSIMVTIRRRSHARVVQRLEIVMRVTSSTVEKGFVLQWTLGRHQRLVPKVLFVAGKQIDVVESAGSPAILVPSTTTAGSDGLVEVRVSVEVVEYGVVAFGEDPIECALPVLPGPVGVLDVEVDGEVGVRIVSASGMVVLSSSKARGFDVDSAPLVLVGVGPSGVSSRRNRLLDLVAFLVVVAGLATVLVRQQWAIQRLAADLAAFESSFLPTDTSPIPRIPSAAVTTAIPPVSDPTPLAPPSQSSTVSRTDLLPTLDQLDFPLLGQIRAFFGTLQLVLARLFARS